MNKIGNLQRVDLRQVWGSEPNDFTPWLQENIEVLNDAIGLSISILDREHKPTERLSVDLRGEAETGLVVIENQLEASNHDHLGKLITYLTAVDAKVGIWIVADPKPEHIGAINWLNQTNLADFYLVKLEAVQIDTSLPAGLLTLIVGPSEEGRQLGVEKQEDTVFQRFWTQLLDRARERTQLHDKISPGKSGEIWASTKTAGFSLKYTIRQHDAEVGLYIERYDKNENYEILRALEAKKGEIEKAFGGSIEWEQRDDTRNCRIVKPIAQGGYRNEPEDWERIQYVMIDAMIRLNNAFEPHYEAL